MKYTYFVNSLRKIIKHPYKIGPSICIDVLKSKIRIKHKILNNYTIYPVKIYGHSFHHLNLIIHANNKITRFEPNNSFLRLDNWFKMIFTGYHFNTVSLSYSSNCGFHCIDFIRKLCENPIINESNGNTVNIST